ncbi:MAG: hypothetical protein MJ189_01380 [Coriobacteriales bacterium]|nr:hypothetical protein [Coriobacteriales bacterium]
MPYCLKCGKKLDENYNAEFCSECKPATIQNNAEKQNLTKKNRKPLIVGAVCICLIIAGFGAFFLFKAITQPMLYKVNLGSFIENYSLGDATRIPIKITGKTSNNKAYDETIFITNGDNDDLKLEKGEYKLIFLASPLCKNGDFYSLPESELNFKIDEEYLKNTSTGLITEDKYKLKKMDPALITDEDLDKSYEYAVKDKTYNNSDDAYLKTTKEKRDEALAALQTNQVQNESTSNKTSMPSMSEIVEKYGVPIARGEFWGVWLYASKSQSEAAAYAEKVRADGFPAGTYLTTEWANLNPEPWYCVNACTCKTEDLAKELLELCKSQGYKGGDIQYSGKYLGR